MFCSVMLIVQLRAQLVAALHSGLPDTRQRVLLEARWLPGSPGKLAPQHVQIQLWWLKLQLLRLIILRYQEAGSATEAFVYTSCTAQSLVCCAPESL